MDAGKAYYLGVLNAERYLPSGSEVKWKGKRQHSGDTLLGSPRSELERKERKERKEKRHTDKMGRVQRGGKRQHPGEIIILGFYEPPISLTVFGGLLDTWLKFLIKVGFLRRMGRSHKISANLGPGISVYFPGLVPITCVRIGVIRLREPSRFYSHVRDTTLKIDASSHLKQKLWRPAKIGLYKK